MVFRPQLKPVLEGITKLELLGASLQIAQIQATNPKPSPLQASSAAELAEQSFVRSERDPRIALANIRSDLEQELFRPSELGLSPPIEALTTTSRRINDLVETAILDVAIAHNIREFLKIASEVLYAKRNYSETYLRRAVDVGASLVTEVRRRIIGAELEHHFSKNILWYSARLPESSPGEIRSVVAASAPDFEYDYDLYRATIQRFNRRENARATAEVNYEPMVIKALTLNDFVQVLKFREQEVMRVIEEESKLPKDRELDYSEWKWPQEWGDIGWNGPVLRETRLAHSDLEKVRHALAAYQRRLYK